MNFKEIAAYSLGLFGFQAIVGLLNSYQAEFDASILGADIAVVGILVLVAKILSAVFDPFVGNMIDRSKSKNGKFKSMIAKSILPLLVMSAVVFIDVPFKVTPHGLEHYKNQITKKVLEPLHERYGTDISDASIRKAVAEHNEVCRIITEIGDMRKLANPPITGYEFHVLCLVSYCCPKALIIDKLRETLEEVKTRVSDAKPAHRARVVVVGSEIDDLDFTRTVEQSGALIVADRFCFGSFPDSEPALDQICRFYQETSQCPRYMSQDKVHGRYEFVDKLAKEYNAQGIIYEQMKFCEFWGYERALASHVMTELYNYPTVCVDREYTGNASGQLRTRVQAFVESLEIKQIHKEKGGR